MPFASVRRPRRVAAAAAAAVVAAALALGACAAPLPPRDDDAHLATLVSALRSRPLVLLGEVHDNAALHALRLRALRRLVDGGARPALLLEQFDRERQADIDRAAARPGASADEVIAAATAGRPPAMQGWQWDFYRPYVALALEHRLPLVAANVSRDDTRRVVSGGLAAAGFDARVPADIEAAQAEAIADGHCRQIDAAQARPLVAAQVARDQFMARSVEAQAGRGAVLLAGNGHVRADIGVPRWLTPRTRARSVSIGLLEGDTAAAAGAYDVALAVPAQPRPDPCEGLAPAAAGR